MSVIKFSERLSELRKKRNLTQAELGAKLNLSQSTLAMWENKKREPDIETVARLSSYFNVSISYMIGLSDDPHSDVLDTPPKDSSMDDDYHKIERFARNGSSKDRKRAVVILEAAFDHAFDNDDDDEEDI